MFQPPILVVINIIHVIVEQDVQLLPWRNATTPPDIIRLVHRVAHTPRVWPPGRGGVQVARPRAGPPGAGPAQVYTGIRTCAPRHVYMSGGVLRYPIRAFVMKVMYVDVLLENILQLIQITIYHHVLIVLPENGQIQ